MLFIRVLTLISLYAANIRASSHWVVTETGLIQSKDDSPFVMSRPFDLLSFLNQETRWQNTISIYHDLVMRQKIVNSLWTDLNEQTELTKNELCGTIGEVDWYSVVVEDGKGVGIKDKDFMPYAIEDIGNTEVPDCKKISSLTFSMSTFEHLEGMINRGNLNATAETSLPQSFPTELSINQYGHWLSDVLRRNTTSWLHYNLASIYWRLQGNVPKALECSRRAVHYSPRHYKNIPLLCMGAILHRSKQPEDAIIVLGASVDHAPMFPLSHFTLGEAYATAGYFNSSIKHLNTSMKLHKSLSKVIKYQNAVLCHIDMFPKMQYAQRIMNKLSVELQEFREIELQWLKIHAAFVKTMNHNIENSNMNVDKNCLKMEELTHLKIRDLYRDRDRNKLIQYLVSNPQYTEQWKNEKGVKALDIALDLEQAVKRIVTQSGPVNKNFMGNSSHIERKKNEILKEIGPMPSFPEIFPEPIRFLDNDASGIAGEEPVLKSSFHMPEISVSEHMELTMLKQADGKVRYPSNMKVNRNKMDFDKNPDWPSIEFCNLAKVDFPDYADTVYPVFMPFEHKGISVKSLLTGKIGVSALEEHELPWHPPLCPNDKDLALYTAKKGIKVQLGTETIAHEYLRLKLHAYVSLDHYELVKKMQDAEIGQRIHTAMRKKLARKWVLYTLASLYWRVRGNTVNALNCLLAAHHAPDNKHPDVVLVSLASVLLEMGLWSDALTTVEEAYRLNPYEPPTNFLLAQLHLIKKQEKAQFFHLKQVLRVEPMYLSGHAQSMLNCWACIAKQMNALKELANAVDSDGEHGICGDTDTGVRMVCDKDGTNCHLENKDCSGANKESSTLVRMLNEDNIHAPLFSQKHLESSFNRALSGKPSESHDKAGHLRSYELMMRAVAEQMALCKTQDCGVTFNLLELKKEDCSYYMLNSKYWLHFVSFQQELSELEIQISVEITSMPPSHKKTPECVVPPSAGGDFFLSRVLAADTAGWGALLALMQHFAELFNHHDYALLGAKLARYVDTKAGCWWGALAAGWWCGAVGRGACAVRCLAAAHALAPAHAAGAALRPLVALLHLQNKNKDAMDIAYLSFYSTPKSKVEALLVGLSHFFNHEIDEAIWMYRYALAYDYTYVPASACLHTSLCRLAFDKDGLKKQHQTPT